MTSQNAASRSRHAGLTPENAELLAQYGSGGVRPKPAIGRLGLWSAVRGRLLMAAWASAVVVPEGP
jgi:hypothetical protein